MFRITLERLPLRLDFEAGSVAEAVAILQEQDTQLRQIVAIADDMAGTTNEAPTTEADKGANAEPARRGRKPKANQPDPSTAQAPPPAPVPAPAAANLAIPADGGIPQFLQRTAETAPAAAAPPPPPPPAPPAPPVAPPSGILAGKVIMNLDQRKAASVDGGKVLADWLAQCGLVQAGASYDEAIAVVRLQGDDKLAAIAGQLGVA
jgi:hypothetical protein